WLRFSTTDTNGADIADHTEAVGDADAVRSTELGLRNIRRTVPMLIPATERPGYDYSDLAELYERLIGQWTTELSHVVSLVGGVESRGKAWGRRVPALPRCRESIMRRQWSSSTARHSPPLIFSSTRTCSGGSRSMER